MTTAAMVVWASLVGIAHAQGCLAAVEAGLRPGAPAPPAGCFEQGSSWIDEDGSGSGSDAVRVGLARLGAALEPGSKPRWVRLSTKTWLLTGLEGRRGWFHVALRLSGRAAFWEGGTVYVGARPWPEERPGPAPAGPSGDDFVQTFNDVFGAGRVEELAARWASDAEFVSAIGPFVGPEVGVFFRNQAKRYASPRFADVTQHGRAPDGSWVLEGSLTGSCRANGREFRIPFLMHLRFRGPLIGNLYEAFSTLADGCGPFWTMPR